MDAIARHPDLAVRFLYTCLDREARNEFFGHPFHENYSSDRAKIALLQRRVVDPRSNALPALERLGEAMMHLGDQGPRPDPRVLPLLAWTATESGRHREALALAALASPEAQASDDLLHVTATAALRAGLYEESLRALSRLGERHPHSPLAVDLPWRTAVTARLAGKPAIAAEALWPVVSANPMMESSDESEDPPVPSIRIGYETMQLFDAILQFSPLSDLTPLLDSPQPGLAAVARAILGGRAIAAGDFELAATMIAPQAEPRDEQATAWLLGAEASLTPEKWNELAGPIAQLQLAISKSRNPAERARKQLELARLWLAARGQLTLPSNEMLFPANDDRHLANIRRRQNAATLGLDDSLAVLELDRRDEAWHALHAALAAADAHPDAEIEALTLANECLFRMAELSIYQGRRAVENHHSALSKSLVTRIRAQGGDAVAWQFPIVGEATPWMPGDYNPTNAEFALLSALDPAPPLDPSDPSAQPDASRSASEARSTTRDLLMDLPADRAGLARRLAEARATYLPALLSSDDAWRLNQLDDFEALVATDDIPENLLLPYIRMRLNGEPAPLHDPAWEPALDFLEYWEIIRKLPDGIPETVEIWDAWLARHPHSPKAEAAEFRRLRLLCRQHRSRVRVGVERWPAASVPWGYKTIRVTRQSPAAPEICLQEIAAYRERHPTPRYAADLDLLESGMRIDAGEWRAALALLTPILANPAHQDLHLDAVLNFADITSRLISPEQRMEVLQAVRATPGAPEILHKLVNGDTFLSRLLPMRAAFQ